MNDSDSLGLATDLAGDRSASRLVPEVIAEAPKAPAANRRRRFRMPSGRLADQGLFLFRHRGLFVVFLLPAALLAVLERWSASVPPAPGFGWLAACLSVSLFGLAIRAMALGSAPPGASTRSLRPPSASRLNTTGMYSLSRHPVYLGNLFVLLGFALALRSWWFVLTAALVYWLLYRRVIAAEERFLEDRFGASHRRWAERTPAFWPSPRLWQPPQYPFRWRTVILREYNSLLLIGSIFLFLRMIDQVVVGRLTPGVWLQQDLLLIGSVFGVAVLVTVLRQVRKRGHSGH